MCMCRCFSWQGTRDELADADLLAAVVNCLSDRASLQLFAQADHSFHVPARSGRTDAEVRREMLDRLAAWIGTLTEEHGRAHES
jgi:dienelactone hydrolase